MTECPSVMALVEELGRSDVVVYLDLDPYDASPLNGSLRFRGAGLRYVRVWLRPRQADTEVLPILAHELQHAVEVGARSAVPFAWRSCRSACSIAS